MNKLTFLLAFVFFTSQSFGQQTASVHFDSDSYRLTPFQTEKINVLIMQLEGERCSVSIHGHTDSDASDYYNIRLSEQRVASVKNYISNHYDTIQLNDEAFYGEKKPLNDNNDPKAKAQNRRVEITANCQPKKPNQERIQNIWPTLNQLQPKPTDLRFDGAEGGAFALKNGARISIAPNTFPKGQVNLKVSECLTVGDAFAYGLTTQSNQAGDGLQSSGMYRVQAFQNNRIVPNLKSNEITIYIPVNEEDYQTFDATQERQYTEWTSREGGEDKYLKPYLSLCELTTCNVEVQSRRTYYSFVNCSFFWCKVKSFFNRSYKKERDQYVYTAIQRNPNFKALYNVYSAELDKEFGSESKFAEFVANNNHQAILDKMNALFPRFTTDIFYAMQMPSYSWVNCDRFMQFPNLTTISIDEKTEEGKDIRLYFKRLNCVMRPNGTSNKKSKFKRVPIGKIATLVILKKVNDVLLMSSNDFKIGEEPKIHFNPVQSNEILKVFGN
ncbi:MAG: hypothetical protein ACI8SE_000237 [Bacteroidia bacterium]|jgi:hypothetical protein